MPEIPDGAKKPQDHAAKAEALGEPIVISHNDVEYTIPLDALDDVETFGLIGRMQMADERSATLYLPLILERVLGPAQYARFLAANRNEAGRVPSKPLGEIWTRLDAAAGNLQASRGS